ncbi:hypothetical protein ZIOFF_053039 [Zingiber officinale]|uniref:DUF4378 domain-containing protein n=1 Tax=Zingiber officinale TaxID=94328 RepID=A0A8J5KLN9_ZINOF|nr:hypothetical protein ZIOFF_053039 [Zingiber officinale]
MACPSKPSPTGSGRWLSDILAEQQEPFLLDLYLIEKGHHESLPTPLCWTTKRLTRKHGLGTFQLLKCMLTKFLHGKALNWGEKKIVLPLHHLPSPVSVDESKQLSPVSVLDLHSSGDDSPAHLNSNAQEIKDFNVFQELLELACCSTFADPAANSGKQFDEAEEFVLNNEKDDKSILHCHGSLAPEIADETLHLTSTEMSNTRRKWYELQPHVREIGFDLEAVIFHDIREDVILEMLDFLV